jgi:starch synthase
MSREFHVQEGLGLRVDPAAPLVGCITRLVPQKGCHLIRHALFATRDAGGQVC